MNCWSCTKRYTWVEKTKFPAFICLAQSSSHVLKLLYHCKQTHNCQNAGERCQKINPNTKEKYCRNRVQGDSADHVFVPAQHTFTKSQAEVLQDAGRATVNGDEFEIDEDLIGGHYIYPAYGQKHWQRLPTNPLLFFVMRSSTNVQVRGQHGG
jgi:hypothetical protein